MSARLTQLVLACLSVLAIGLAMSMPRIALADYTIPSGPYTSVVGPNGTYLIEDGTVLNPNDASTFWNNSTGFSRVLIPGGPIDCGIYDGCVLFDTESTTLIGVASCDLPAITDGSYAKLYVDTDSEYNLPDEDCRGIGSDYHPTFVLLIDTGAPSGAYTHMQRHEVGHALGLGDTDTSVTCWTESSVYYPLMKNSSTNCDNYPNNVTATYNEVQGVIDRNDWY